MSSALNSVKSIFSAKSKIPIMPPNVTVRNITSNVFELVLVEYFDPHKQGFHIRQVGKVLANATDGLGLTNSTTRADVPELPADAKPFETRQVNIRIDPFSKVSTDIVSQIHKPGERFRLTFQVEGGGQHQMYCPVPTSGTQGLHVIGDDPGHRFTGIYITNEAFATIYSSTDLNAWMGKLPDNTPIGALSIPGTHNSPTCFVAPPSVRCQAVSPWDQLQNGVRFFDIRVKVPEPFNADSDKPALVHSVFVIDNFREHVFRDLYNDVRKFLDENHSETVLISIKREGGGNANDDQLSQILHRHYLDNNNTWFAEDRLPNLGEARGKTVLIRRFGHPAGFGIDGSSWADNTPNAPSGDGNLCIQDFYEVKAESNIQQKITFACDHLERSGCCVFNPDDANQQRIPIFINFLSASNFWSFDTWPEKIAAKVNPAVVDHLCRKHMVNDEGGVKDGDWSTGVVVCDWVGLGGDWDLVRCIVGMNSRLVR